MSEQPVPTTKPDDQPIEAGEEVIKNLSAIFNAWLPVISSLLSAAATYYFTKEKK